jgi:sugar phosphate isomerase/epimerase
MQWTAAAGMGAGLGAAPANAAKPDVVRTPGGNMKLGMVTYKMGEKMTVDELITFCQTVGIEGVELRATHKHGVEIELSKTEREKVKKTFLDSGIELAGMGSAYEFQSRDAAELKKNVEGAKAYAQLAADVGAPSIKVRPNKLYDDEDHAKTIERIGTNWREVAAFAADLGVQTRMEVHGRGSSEPAKMRQMIDVADHPNALICWNSNSGEQDEKGSIKKNFDLLKDYIGQVHITDIGVYQYPWQQLFDLLAEIGFSGYCFAEIQPNDQPERFMKYYKTLFDLYTGRYQYPQA